MKKLLFILFILFIAHVADAQVASNDAIRAILADRIDKQRRSTGIVVGVIDADGRRIVAHGIRAKGDSRPLDGDTLFEIGSITKVFTALLLADMAERGEVALTDPAAKYLPAGVTMPRRGDAKITLEHLATHTSALPRLPDNLAPKDAANPYADYTVAQLHEALSSIQLTRDVGSQYEYSNLGAGLLGHLLARRAGTDYEKLVRTRILDPLKMKSTGITLSRAMHERLAAGHDEQLTPAANWDLPTLAGAGALRSTANDLLTFLAAQMGLTKTPLAKAMAATVAARRPTTLDGMEIALGWHIATKGGREIIWHNGGTGGYRSFIGYDPKQRVGVVVLSNTSTMAGVDDIGRHLIDPALPLLGGSKDRKQVEVDPQRLESYVGLYELAPEFILTVTRKDNQLFVQATGQPRFEIYPESERDFFLKAVDAQLTFETDAEGPASAVVLHQNGLDQRARRIEGKLPPAPKEHKEIAVDPKLFHGYVGRYQLAPNFIVTVTTEDNRLFVQATGQPRFEVFAEGEKEFFYKVVDAQITFTTDENGRATGLTLHQNGMNMPAKRIE